MTEPQDAAPATRTGSAPHAAAATHPGDRATQHGAPATHPGDAVAPGDLALDEQVCFALYSAARAASGRYRAALDDLGLTYTQYVALLALWERDGRSVTELGERLHLDSGTMSPLLRRLEAQGLLLRVRDAPDERRVTVHLTDAGHALRDRVADVRRRLYDGLDMTPADLAELRALAATFAQAARSLD